MMMVAAGAESHRSGNGAVYPRLCSWAANQPAPAADRATGSWATDFGLSVEVSTATIRILADTVGIT